MEQDRYGIEGKYHVRSQYYDSYHNRDLFDNLDGMMEKRKIRVRTYSLSDTIVKLEYKCKSGSDGIKYSIPITREQALLLEQKQYGFLVEREEELAKRLYSKMILNAYQPVTIIDYHREAYRYPVNDIRVTFDTDLRGTDNPYGLFQDDLFSKPLLAEDCGVLEIKYNDFLPYFIKEIWSELDQMVDAMSKYSRARMI